MDRASGKTIRMVSHHENGEAIQEHEQALLGSPMLAPEAMSDTYMAEAQDHIATQNGEALVCEIEHRIVGCLLGYINEDDDPAVDDTLNQHALIMDIYVEPAFRQQGVATALIDMYAELMRAKGCQWLRVWSKSKNQTAINAYLKYGFDPYESIFVKKL